MIDTSTQYKNVIYDDGTITRMQINFSNIDVTAKKTATATTNSAKSYASASGTINNANNNNVYTIIENGWLLDSTAKPLPDTPTGNYDYFSGYQADANGTFTTNPIITYTWSENHSSSGLTITTVNPIFEMIIRAYDYAGSLIGSYTWTNTDATITIKDHARVPIEYRIEYGMADYQKIELEVVKVLPYAYARIQEVEFGLEYVFSDEIVEASVVESTDIKSQSIESNQFTFTMNNIDNTYNKYNPDTFLKYLQANQKLTANVKVLVDETTGSFELVPLGEFYLQSWNCPTQYTAQFVANDVMMKLSNNTYAHSPIYTNATVSTIVSDLINDIDSTIEYTIDDTIASTTLSGYIPITDYRTALQMIALASCSIVKVNREGVITFTPYNVGTAVENLDYAKKEFAIDNEDERYSAVIVTDNELIAGSTSEQLYSGTCTGNVQISIEPASDVAVSGTCTSYTVYANCVEVVGASGTITITGKKYTQQNQSVVKKLDNASAGVTAQTMEISSIQLIGNTTIASNVATFVLAQLQHYIRNEFNWLSNPALEIGDTVTLQVTDDLYKTGIVTNNSFTFNGALQETTEVTL